MKRSKQTYYVAGSFLVAISGPLPYIAIMIAVQHRVSYPDLKEHDIVAFKGMDIVRLARLKKLK
jgi:hypothetical protein